MVKEESEKIILIKDGKEIECEVLFTFDCEENGKSYVGYTDNVFVNDNVKTIYVSSYDPVFGMGKLEDIKDPREIAMVRNVLEQIEEESSK